MSLINTKHGIIFRRITIQKLQTERSENEKKKKTGREQQIQLNLQLIQDKGHSIRKCDKLIKVTDVIQK